MAKKQVRLEIQAEDEKTIIETTALMKDNILTFFDKEKVKHEISFTESQIVYRKYGETSMAFYFEENKRTQGIYTVMNNQIEFSIFTHKLIHKTEMLDIRYSLYQDNIKHHEAQFTLKYTPMKEG